MNIFPRTIEAELQTLELYAKARRCLQRVLSENTYILYFGFLFTFPKLILPRTGDSVVLGDTIRRCEC